MNLPTKFPVQLMYVSIPLPVLAIHICNYVICMFQIDGGLATESEKRVLFNVHTVMNTGRDTFVRLSPVDLATGKSYYIWVMGKFILTCNVVCIALIKH
jgi:hypothetical protein